MKILLWVNDWDLHHWEVGLSLIRNDHQHMLKKVLLHHSSLSIDWHQLLKGTISDECWREDSYLWILDIVLYMYDQLEMLSSVVFGLHFQHYQYVHRIWEEFRPLLYGHFHKHNPMLIFREKEWFVFMIIVKVLFITWISSTSSLNNIGTYEKKIDWRRSTRRILPFSMRNWTSSMCPSCDASINGVDWPKLISAPFDRRILTTSKNPPAQANVTTLTYSYSPSELFNQHLHAVSCASSVFRLTFAPRMIPSVLFLFYLKSMQIFTFRNE